ncbi:MAG: hypothetical protein RIF39_00580 [Cyclobacteriaceae bacterium]
MKKLIIITVVVVGAISAFGFVLKPTPTVKDQSQIANVKVGAEKSGFTETTSW